MVIHNDLPTEDTMTDQVKHLTDNWNLLVHKLTAFTKLNLKLILSQVQDYINNYTYIHSRNPYFWERLR